MALVVGGGWGGRGIWTAGSPGGGGPDLWVQSLQEGPEMAARVETEPGCEGAA